MAGYISFENVRVWIKETASVVGKKEKEGPLGDRFDLSDDSNLFGMKTWEEAESEMQRQAFNVLLSKAKTDPSQVEAVISGDLMNQCVGGAYSFSNQKVPYVGIYGACSTFALGTLIGGMMINAGYCNMIAAITSSHYCSAERQFRTPLEYGSQRTPTAQWTVTGAGGVLLTSEVGSVRLVDACIGRIVDKGISDANNMGAAMAPAAADTILSYLRATGRSISDFDRIYTGDLGAEGKAILNDLLRIEGVDARGVLDDCGCLIYDAAEQDVHCGGSGCGCSACVFSSELYPMLKEGRSREMLLIGTGALMSPQSLMQGKTIPAVAHLVRFSSI